MIDGKEERRYLEAAPQFKSLNQYDSNMIRTGFQRIPQKEVQGHAEGEKQGQKNKKVAKQKAAKSDEGKPPKQSRRKKGLSAG